MKKILTLLILVLIATPILWAKANTEKPQLVFFYMHGCSACKQFTPLYEKMASKFATKFQFIKQDANSSSLANKLNVNSVPTVFIINPKTQATTHVAYDCMMQEGCFENTLKNY